MRMNVLHMEHFITDFCNIYERILPRDLLENHIVIALAITICILL